MTHSDFLVGFLIDLLNACTSITWTENLLDTNSFSHAFSKQQMWKQTHRHVFSVKSEVCTSSTLEKCSSLLVVRKIIPSSNLSTVPLTVNNLCLLWFYYDWQFVTSAVFMCCIVPFSFISYSVVDITETKSLKQSVMPDLWILV